ncbi:c-type cytochrome [Pseudooceanicola sp.]|uniref:c-type cytochrome n=1 Tax=Pseudooceanicola sp. TaxID=1914328 RepID=UPI0035C6DC77
MRAVLLTLVFLAGLGLAGAAAVVTFGLYNVSAQAGHLPGVSWLLHTTFRNSVALRAPSMEDAPPLDDPDLIALGAGHYATACAFCHAAPGEARAATAAAMVPAPPPIEEAVAQWEPNELHWIVENGVKMTGMPGWPVEERGDEVWAVVAYLVAIQNGQAPKLPEASEGVAYCRTCHEAIAGPVPRLDILSATYIEDQLGLYATGVRPSGIMAQAVSVVEREDFAGLARELAASTTAPTARAIAGDGAAGERLAKQGTRDVPACTACHNGEAGKGPVLHGQSEAYLAQHLKLWREGTYQHNAKMLAAARDLSDAEIAALAAWFASLNSEE